MEKESYSSYIGNVFTRASSTYDEEDPKFFSYFGRKLAEFSPISHDMNVLDLACGRGAVFYPILEELSHQGCLIGVDISEGMVDKLNMELIAYRLTNAVAIQMDAENLEFHDEFFDLITCGLSIFLFDNLSQVFKELKRILKSTGYLTLSSWKSLDINQYSWYTSVLNKYLPNESSQPTKKMIETIDFFTVEGIEALLKKENFRIVKIATEEKTFTYTSAQNFWNKIWSGAERTTLEKIPDNKIDQFKKELFESFNSVKGEDGFNFKMGIIYACCKK